MNNKELIARTRETIANPTKMNCAQLSNALLSADINEFVNPSLFYAVQEVLSALSRIRHFEEIAKDLTV